MQCEELQKKKYFKSVQQTADDGFIMTGYTVDTANPKINCFLLKIDSNGNVQWDKSFAGAGSGCSVVITSDGGYMVSRQIYYEISLIKMDGNGNVQWNKSFGNSSLFSLSLGWPNDLAKTKDGGFIITGRISLMNTWDMDVYLLKTDSIGNVLWNKSFSSQKYERGASVIETYDGGYFIVGTVADTSQVSALLIKTDSDGNLQWSKMTGGTISSHGWGAAPTSDSGIVFTGLLIDTLMNQGYGSLYKVDNNGSPLWAKDYRDSSFSLLSEILETQDGGLAMVGYKVDSTAKTFLIKTDKDGNSGCMENNLSLQLANYPLSVDTPLIVSTLISDSVLSGFTISVTLPKEDSILCTTAGIQNHSEGIQQVSVYPNPFSETATLRITNPSELRMKEVELTMYDMIGKQVHPSIIRNSDSFVIRRGNLPAGIYFYQLLNENEIIATGKLCIE